MVCHRRHVILANAGPCRLVTAALLWLLACCVSAQDLVVFDFNGSAPAQHAPWAQTSLLRPGVALTGWSNGPGIMPLATDNAYAVAVGAGATPSTLAEALAAGHYLEFALTPQPGQPLDLALLQVRFTIQRASWHAPQAYALFSSIDGWATPAAALHVASGFEGNGDEDARAFRFFLPDHARFRGLTTTVQFRLVPYQASWGGHETRLLAFSITEFQGAIHSLTLQAGPGGTAWSVPPAGLHAEGDVVRLYAEPDPGQAFAGWSGDRSGRGNPLTLVMDADHAVSATFQPRASGPMAVGTNLGGIADWGTDWPFLDMLDKTRDWSSRNADGSGAWDSGLAAAAPLDADGYPLQVPFDPGGGAPPQILHTILMNLYQTGPWRLSYSGSGQLRVGFSGGGWQTVNASGGGSFDFTVGEANAMFVLEVHATAAADPLRDFRLLPVTPPAGSAAVTPFHPRYLERLQPFALMRYMDWGATNASPLAHWSERTTPTHHTQARAQGVAAEHIARLSTLLDRDAWVNIPHQADDAYVRELARVLRDQLPGHLKVWVEYSNETWNFHPAFSQTQYVMDRGVALGLDSDPFRAGQRFVALRSVQIWRIFAEEFAAAAAQRLVRVLATQSGWPEVTDQRIAAINDPLLNPDRVMPDALAIAPYFGSAFSPADITANGYPTVEQVVGVLSTSSIGDARTWVAYHRQVADRQGMRLVCYEGGQHFVGIQGAEGDATLTAILIAANRHPDMYLRYREYLDMLEQEGVSLFANFSYVSEPGQWGSWGVLEYQDQPTADAHKYRALIDWIASRQDLVFANGFETP